MPKVKKQKAIFVKPSLTKPQTAEKKPSKQRLRLVTEPRTPDRWKCSSVIDQQSAEAVAKLLAAAETRTSGASIKSLTLAPHIVHKKPTFAVTCETLKHLPLLKQLLARVDLLQQHEQLSPSAAYVLTYELLFGQGFRKRGPAEQVIVKQQDALQSALQSLLQESSVSDAAAWLSHQQQQQDDKHPQQQTVQHPRYARVNTLKATVADVLQQLQQEFESPAAGQFADHDTVDYHPRKKHKKQKRSPAGHDVAEGSAAVAGSDAGLSRVRVDDLLPDVLVLPAGTDLHDHPLVQQGVLVLQSKASCMPAHALRPQPGWHVVDCCAAPGNKTTHVAALLHAVQIGSRVSKKEPLSGKTPRADVAEDVRVFAFDKDPKRLKRLQANLLHTGAADIITAKRADFLSLDPTAPQFSKVQGVILDPSCSGSGTIVSRMDHLLPAAAAAAGSIAEQQHHDQQEQQRIEQLAKFQEAAILHALKFPALKRLVYSTCSIHQRENEDVVARVLPAATELGFRLTNPFPQWHRRGLPVFEGSEKLIRTDPYLDATDGFFVAVFARGS